MSTTNGKATTKQALQQPTPAEAGKLRLSIDSLTPRDLIRARVMLGGRDPNEVLAGADTYERVTLMMWCLKSRTDPAFTWDEALDTPFGEFDASEEEPPPPTGPGGSPGPELETKQTSASKPRRPADAPALS